jgi:phosphopantothenoylcysteine decarboxylase/phosphopantothenate--cysteine ligase
MRVVVTTGRTEEPLTRDGVVITNGFTGRQGQEIARAFVQRGAEVIVVSGLTALPDTAGARTVHVTTMREMQDAVLREIETPTDIYISAAAIVDFGMIAPLPLRLKPGEAFRLEMTENPSLLAAVARHGSRPKIVVGFAAQSADTLLEYAVAKFESSGVDLTVANPIGPGSTTMQDAARNEIYFISRAGVEKAGSMTKAEAAEKIVEKTLPLL